MREIAFVPSSHGEAVDASRGGHQGILPDDIGTAVQASMLFAFTPVLRVYSVGLELVMDRIIHNVDN